MVYKRPYTRMNRGRPAAKRASKRVARTRGLTRKVPSRKPGLHPFVVAQGNPFHSAAIGVKIPDLNNLPSCTVLARNMYALIGNATQGSAAVFGTLPKYAYDVCKSDGSGTFTSWDWTSLTASPTYQNIDQYTPMYTEFGLVRCVAHGIRLMCGSSDTNTQGFVHIALVGMPASGAGWVLPKNLTDMRNQIVYKKLTIAQLALEPYIFANRFLDETAFAYRMPNAEHAQGATTATWNTQNQWGHIVIALEGASTSTTVSIETIHHFECIPKPTYNSATNSTTPPANNDPTALADGQLSGAINGGTERLMNQALEVIDDMSRKAEWVAAYLNDPRYAQIATAAEWISANAGLFQRVYNGDTRAAYQLGRNVRDALNTSGSQRPRTRQRLD